MLTLRGRTMQDNMVRSSVNTLRGVLLVEKMGDVPCISLLVIEHAHRPMWSVVRNERRSYFQWNTHKSESYPNQGQYRDSL